MFFSENVIRSPNFPKPYPAGQACDSFAPNPDLSVEMSIHVFDVSIYVFILLEFSLTFILHSQTWKT